MTPRKCSHRANPASEAWLKVEAVCKHFLFVASGHKPRQKLHSGNWKKTRMAVGQSNSVEKIIYGWVALPHSHLCRHTSDFFFNRFRSAFVMPYVPRWSIIFCSLRGYGLPTHKQKVLARVATHFLSCGGRACVAPCFLSAPFPRLPSPATPMQAGGGAVASRA
jgi:hypothetical protein